MEPKMNFLINGKSLLFPGTREESVDNDSQNWNSHNNGKESYDGVAIETRTKHKKARIEKGSDQIAYCKNALLLLLEPVPLSPYFLFFSPSTKYYVLVCPWALQIYQWG